MQSVSKMLCSIDESGIVVHYLRLVKPIISRNPFLTNKFVIILNSYSSKMFSRYDISQYEFLLPLSANNISHPKFSHIESSFSALVLVLALGVLALLGEKKG